MDDIGVHYLRGCSGSGVPFRSAAVRGSSEAKAVVMARLARILRSSDWEHGAKKPIL